MSKRLYKSATNKVISGVCGGIAEYFNVDPTIVRLIVVILSLGGAGSPILIYIIAAIIIPYGSNYEAPPSDFYDQGHNGPQQ